MRKLMLIFVVFLVGACAQNRQDQKPWPAQLQGFKNFTNEQKANFMQYANDLNARAGQTLITLSSGGEDNFPVEISLVPAPPTNPSRAGYAVMTGDRCTIEISSFLMQPERQAYDESVFLHELGHCAGLDHDPTPGTIMYATTSRFDSYSPEVINSFVKTFLNAIELR